MGSAGPPGDQGVPGIPGNVRGVLPFSPKTLPTFLWKLQEGKPGMNAAEKNYCPCPPRSGSDPGGAGHSSTRRGVRSGQVKLAVKS